MKSATAKRQPLGELRITAEMRARDGHIKAWAQTARDAVSLYLEAIERDPGATITLTMERS